MLCLGIRHPPSLCLLQVSPKQKTNTWRYDLKLHHVYSQLMEKSYVLTKDSPLHVTNKTTKSTQQISWEASLFYAEQSFHLKQL